MKKLFIAFVLTLSLIGGFTVGTAFELVYEASTFHPIHWNKKPILVNCYGEDLPVGRVKNAISFWKNYGFHFERYVHRPLDKFCDMNFAKGYVVIKRDSGKYISSDDNRTLAATKRNYSAFIITSAEIHMKFGTHDLEKLLEHEIGHALGMGHTDIPNHIMNPVLENMSLIYWDP